MKRVIIVLVIIFLLVIIFQKPGIELSPTEEDIFFQENLNYSFITSDGERIFYDVMFNSSFVKGPIVVVSDTFSQTSTRVQNRQFSRWFANKGYFVINIETRGKGESSGIHEVNGKECLDLYESVLDASKNSMFSQYIDNSSIYIIGASGGGGRTYSCISTYPDFYTAAGVLFGMSNYSRWYNDSPIFRNQLTAWISGTPITNSEGFESRGGLTSVKNVQIPVFVQHDPNDTTVQIVQGREYNKSMVLSEKEIVFLETPGLGHSFNVQEVYKNNIHLFFSNKQGFSNIPNSGQYTITQFLHTDKFRIDLMSVGKIAYLDYNLGNQINLNLRTLSYSGPSKIELYGLSKRTPYLIKSGSTNQTLISDNKGNLMFMQNISTSSINITVSKITAIAQRT